MATCRDCNGSGKIDKYKFDPKTGQRIDFTDPCSRCGGSGNE